MEITTPGSEASTALVPALNALVRSGKAEVSRREGSLEQVRSGVGQRATTSIVDPGSAQLGGRPTYLCFEGPEDVVVRAAESLAGRGVEASVLTLPGPVATALLGEESPYAHTPSVTPRSIGGPSLRDGLGLSNQEADLHLRLEDKTSADLSDGEENPLPLEREDLVEGWHEQRDYLWDRERIDVRASHMPPGYYAKRMGTRLEVDESGHSRWNYDPQWRPVEVSSRPPRRFKTRIVMAELEGTRPLLIRSGEKVIACVSDDGSEVRLYEDPRSGLYKVEGHATRFTYWTETREESAPDEQISTEEERDGVIALDDLDEPTQAWVRALLKDGPPSIAHIIAIQKAWQERFDYDARYRCRGATTADYVRNLIQNPKGKCAEAGEGLAVLYRLLGKFSRVWSGYHYESSDRKLASHRWPSVLSGRQWMRMEGTPPTSTFVSLDFQPMPLCHPLRGRSFGDGLRDGTAEVIHHLQSIATRQNMVRLTIGTALVGAMAGLVGAGMMMQDRYQVLGSDTSSEHP